jgi:hypothetical protein
MFRASTHRLRSWLSAATADILGGDLEADETEIEYFRGHPHRRELRFETRRRPGAVPPRPAHCIFPVRPRDAAPDRDRAAY